MPNTTEAAKAKMIEILNGKEAAKINFTLFNVRISGSIYPTVAKDLMTDESYFFSRKVEVADLNDGVAAAYHNPSNTFLFGKHDYLGGRRFGESVIHEATHAWLDRVMASWLTLWENEAIAYVAGHIYARHVHLGLRRFKSTNHRPAWVVADQILNGQTPSEKTLRWLTSTIRANFGLGKDFEQTYISLDG